MTDGKPADEASIPSVGQCVTFMSDEGRTTPILVRKHGTEPFGVVVVHGGPGAAGDMGPVAQRLAEPRGILEPMQTASTVDGQVEELRTALESLAVPPVVLIGHSWGAWLSCIVAATYPQLVRKLILIGTPPFEQKYVHLIRENRMKGLTHDEQQQFAYLADMLNSAEPGEAKVYLDRLGELVADADTYDPIAIDSLLPIPSISKTAGEIYAGVWPEAARMRQTGELLQLMARIECPVVAIHGEQDPHPAEGMGAPLSGTLRDFQIVILEKCGHAPWRERQAVDKFYEVLERHVTASTQPA
jgi:pimeloyl-ACP methyl ester carboxylesterase